MKSKEIYIVKRSENILGDNNIHLEDLSQAVRTAMVVGETSVFDIENNRFYVDIPTAQRTGTETQKASYINLAVQNYMEAVRKGDTEKITQL